MKTASKLVTEGSPKQFHLLLLSFFLPSPTLFSFFSRTMCFLIVLYLIVLHLCFLMIAFAGTGYEQRRHQKLYLSPPLTSLEKRLLKILEIWSFWDSKVMFFFWFYSLALSFALYEKEAENWMNQTSFLWKNNFEFFSKKKTTLRFSCFLPSL